MAPDAVGQTYDLIVIGSGPAGETGAVTAALFRKRVALVEKRKQLGGASTNTGTLPSKTLRETALALSGLQSRELYGVDLSLRREATLADFMYHEERVKSQERSREMINLQRENIHLYQGTASFADPHTIRITGSGESVLLRGEKILIATGSSPIRPPGFAFEDRRILDSDEILTMDRLPRALVVVGAGVIGSEYACTFAALGCSVTVLDGQNVLLPFLDKEVSRALVGAMESLGITFCWNEKVGTCEPLESGLVQLTCASGRRFVADHVLVAAGRCSNTEELNLGTVGISPGPKGLLTVDEQYRTHVVHIYAAGDVIGFPALAATSAEQARIAVCHAFDCDDKSALARILPTGVYTIPEVAMIGETEEALKAKGIDYVVGRAGYMQNTRGQIIGDRHGFLKLLFDRASLKLLGAHILGEHATELIHIGLMAMLTKSGAELFNMACFNYPTLGDLYKSAAYSAIAGRGGATFS